MDEHARAGGRELLSKTFAQHHSINHYHAHSLDFDLVGLELPVNYITNDHEVIKFYDQV